MSNWLASIDGNVWAGVWLLFCVLAIATAQPLLEVLLRRGGRS